MIETLSFGSAEFGAMAPAGMAGRMPPAPPPGELEVTAILPRQAKTISDTGLEARLVAALTLKVLHASGRVPLPLLASRLKLSVSVLREVLSSLMAEQQVEVAWCGDSDIDVQYQLTPIGQRAALDCLAECRYVGPAPVTLAAWRTMVERQSLRQPGASRPTAAEVAAVLADDGLDPEQRALLGAALHAQRALLLHGPSGSGKSTLARKLARLLPGAVAVPYAILVEDRIVRFHDPLRHPAPLPLARQLEERRSCDARWIVCQRPMVHVGAELEPDAFELRYDADKGVYQAPPHLQANNGVFVIDDLGRQRMSTAELLKRWFGILDGGPARVTLGGGQAEAMPFEAMLVFITDLAPASVFDAALLRRIGYRIGLGPLSEPAYRALWRRQCRLHRLDCDEALLDHLVARLHRAGGTPLLACHPQELLGRLFDFASCAGIEPRLTIAALEQAWSSMSAGDSAAVPNPVPNHLAGIAS